MFSALGVTCRSQLLLSVRHFVPHSKTTLLYIPRSLSVSERYNSNSVSPLAREDKDIQIKPRLSLTFTCKVPGCDHRSTHQFSKDSYKKGVVLIQCPQCKSRHLIADHLGWFKDHEATQGGKLRTIEDLMREKGEKVRLGKIGADGVIEYDGE